MKDLLHLVQLEGYQLTRPKLLYLEALPEVKDGVFLEAPDKS
tara:strand:- start:291 stop:416 length:126 start_codon:yes stop_codon:yes gene_type:complete